MAPDIDADVAAAKVFGVVSDPELIYGDAPEPRKAFDGPGLRITSYVSRGDKALTLSEILFGSIARLGRVTFGLLTGEQAARATRLGYVIDLIAPAHLRTEIAALVAIGSPRLRCLSEATGSARRLPRRLRRRARTSDICSSPASGR